MHKYIVMDGQPTEQEQSVTTDCFFQYSRLLVGAAGVTSPWSLLEERDYDGLRPT